MISGCRYELYCASKACKSTQCSIYTIRNHDEAWEANQARIDKDSNTSSIESDKDTRTDGDAESTDISEKEINAVQDCNKVPYTQEVFDAMTKFR